MPQMPSLSKSEHTYYLITLYLSILGTNALLSSVYGPGWISLTIWVASTLLIALMFRAGIREWARRFGRPFVGLKEWSAVRKDAQDTWPVSLTYGFLWGFAVTGVWQDWRMRIVSGLIGAVVWVSISAALRSAKS